MSVCVVNGGHCVCQPDEGIPCIPLQILKAEKESLGQRVKELEDDMQYIEVYLESVSETEDETGLLISAKPLLGDVRKFLSNIIKEKNND